MFLLWVVVLYCKSDSIFLKQPIQLRAGILKTSFDFFTIIFREEVVSMFNIIITFKIMQTSGLIFAKLLTSFLPFFFG